MRIYKPSSRKNISHGRIPKKASIGGIAVQGEGIDMVLINRGQIRGSERIFLRRPVYILAVVLAAIQTFHNERICNKRNRLRRTMPIMITIRRLRTSRVIPRKHSVNKIVGFDAIITLHSLPTKASNIALSIKRQGNARKNRNKKNDKTANQCYNAKRKMFHTKPHPKGEDKKWILFG